MKRTLGLGVGGGLALAAAVWLVAGRPVTSDRGTRDQLRSMAYVAWSNIESGEELQNGVVRYQRGATAEGTNLYSDEISSGAVIIDLAGKVVLELYDPRATPQPWKLIERFDDEHFVVIDASSTLLKIDARSHVVWQRQGVFHHDLFVTEDRRLWAIDLRERRVPELNRLQPIRDDLLVLLDENGIREREIASSSLVLESAELRRLARGSRRNRLVLSDDIFHTNTIEVIDRDVLGNGELLFAKGDLLICWRNLDTVAVIDPTVPEVRWHWGKGELDWPHQPTLLPSGNLLIFDNGTHRGYSRILEVDPANGLIVWSYEGEPRKSFFSSSRGSVQRLANGNTLITESQRGRVFEIDRDGDIV